MRRIAPLAAAVLGTVALVAGPAQGAPAKLKAEMSADKEVPAPGPPGAKGSITFDADPDAGKVCYEFTTEGLENDPPTMGHIHEGGPSTAGPVKVDLKVDANGPKGCVPADGKLVAAIIAQPDAYYANIHTTRYPAGAVRGQLTAG